VWDLESGELKKTLKGHTSVVSSIAVTPDGHQIVSGSRDNTVR
jgi:WD40 repeat protein